ncbi:CPBP family intramembrane glutamic endopeptidase [Bacillus gaemokensis]|uniref:CPBP family intramembrane glutamic endopeptidase n=1 Tax=Bacillus gaemokensis TaxID=574375 RepID=UPI0009E2C431
MGRAILPRNFINEAGRVFSKWISIIICSVVFTFGHPISIGATLYIFMLGIVLAIIYWKTNNFLVPYGVHLLNNSFAMAIHAG